MTQTNSNSPSIVISSLDAVSSFSEPSVTSSIITGTPSNNLLRGTTDNDLISGLEGRDILVGGFGNDVLIGGLDSDTLIGGAGNDRFVINNFDERTDIIVDFNINEDALILSQLFTSSNYKGVAPVDDGYLQFVQDGANTKVQVNPDGVGGFPFTTIAILNNVDAQSLAAVVSNQVI